jgi:hypothetical protein
MSTPDRDFLRQVAAIFADVLRTDEAMCHWLHNSAVDLADLLGCDDDRRRRLHEHAVEVADRLDLPIAES